MSKIKSRSRTNTENAILDLLAQLSGYKSNRNSNGAAHGSGLQENGRSFCSLSSIRGPLGSKASYTAVEGCYVAPVRSEPTDGYCEFA